MNIIDKYTSKDIKLLKLLNPLFGNVAGFGVEFLSEKLRIRESNCKERLNQFLKDGLVEKNSFNEERYNLTPKGEIFLSRHRDSYKEKIIWSIVIPIAISIITSTFVSLYL